jgi:hypothetical protein
MVMNSFGNKNFMQPMGRFNIHSKCFDFFLSSFGGGGSIFSFVPNMFLSSFQWVHVRFPICSPRVFAITPHFNPNNFAQSLPLLIYIGGPKGRHSMFP